jgi:trehalose 6-phosphate phosphatase
MRYVLAPTQRRVLERFAGSRMLLALDFDGTLAPIVADPARAAMRPSTRRLLLHVARAYPCVVISGRARSDVRRRVAGLGVLEVIGNHGIETGAGAAPSPPEVRRWAPVLEERLGGLRGVVIEDKGLSVAVHYRRARDKAAARARILAAAAGLGEARLLWGKQVLNVLPFDAPHKGQALERIRARLGLDTAVYVGDDDTDEDVFALGRPGRLLGIRVRRRAGSAATCYIRSQSEIDRLLRQLLDLRKGRDLGPLPRSASRPTVRPQPD